MRPSTCNKAIQTEDKITQTDENITNSTKQTEAKSQEKPQEIKAEKKQENGSSSNNGKPALKAAPIEMMRKGRDGLLISWGFPLWFSLFSLVCVLYTLNYEHNSSILLLEPMNTYCELPQISSLCFFFIDVT